MKPTSSFEKITVAKAEQLLKNNHSNRPVNQSNLEGIIAEMRRKNFHLTGESINIAENGNLLDGQHRLMAIVESGIEIEMLIVRGLSNDAFKYIDTGKTRNASDVLGIEGFQNPGKIAAIVKLIINFQRGQYVAAANKDSRRKSRTTNADVADFAAKHKELIFDSYPYGYNKENKLISGTTLAALHYIFKKIDDSDANDFCWRVANGENLTKDHPIHLLRQRMLMDIRATRKMNPIEKIALICKAWNMYRQERKATVLKWDSIREAFPKPI